MAKGSALKRDPVVPGPCPPEGCPPATEIVCIETRKVYDFCFQTERLNNLVIPLPDSCPPGGISADVLTGEATCRVTGSQPVDDSGLVNVSLIVIIPAVVEVADEHGTILCRFETTITFAKTVTLCAPDGTQIDCRMVAGNETVVLVGRNVHVSLSVCLLIESTALVKLLVPSYGFCVPSECVTLPSPPVECPPENLFPPQCSPPMAPQRA
ncbi:MAG: hypothetical protein IMW98_04735 [Firmicutes bacterium]|nr:hypothetical protein [Bacillota bacterium]